MDEARNQAEDFIREACVSGRYTEACTRALEAYGHEILSFLRSRLRSVSDGDEAFAMFSEDLWHGLPSFQLRCSARGWMYTLARNAANRYTTSPQRKRDRHVTMDANAQLSALVEHVRSTTRAYLKTDIKHRVRSLRERLADEDQVLLVLHVDRALPWREIAMVMHEQGEHLDAEAITRESARLRKRFERVKAELKTLATEEGLIKG